MIHLQNVTLRAGGFSIRGVDLDVPVGAYGVLMGRTGSGKTTILEAVCGLRRVEAGRVVVAGRDVTRVRVAERGVGYVPQDRALFMTMSVRDHLAFALVIRKWGRAEIERRVAELAELLGITRLLGRGVRDLSGGEGQRVALGRALSHAPGVLLLDEPLSALDEETRGETYDLLKTVQARTGVTTLHVTHSPAEARRLADVVFVVENGRVVRRDAAGVAVEAEA